MMQEEFAQEAESTFPGYAYGLCASGFGADLVVEADLGASEMPTWPAVQQEVEYSRTGWW